VSTTSLRNGVASPVLKTAEDLRTQDIPPQLFLVPGLIPAVGVFLLCGPPKIKKSYLTLDLGISVASDEICLGEKVAAGNVLHIDLEGGETRLQERLKQLLPDAPTWPERFQFATAWPKGKGGLKEIEDWCKRTDGRRLVVIDTWAKFRSHGEKGQGGLYDRDYAALAPFGELALEYGIAIILIHHTNQGRSPDIAERISGSAGVPAGADAYYVFQRVGSDVSLAAQGRDIDDLTFAVAFSTQTWRWSILGNAAEVQQLSDADKAVKFLAENPGDVFSTAQIATNAELSGTRGHLEDAFQDSQGWQDQKGRAR
jgi:RecA-family ATPase